MVQAFEVVLIQYPLPATAVKVEAVTIVCQASPAEAKLNTPEPFVINACPDEPSVAGNVNVKSEATLAGALKAT